MIWPVQLKSRFFISFFSGNETKCPPDQGSLTGFTPGCNGMSHH